MDLSGRRRLHEDLTCPRSDEHGILVSIFASDRQELEREDRRFEKLQGESRQENDPEPAERSPAGQVGHQHLSVIQSQGVGLRKKERCGSFGRRGIVTWKWGDESRFASRDQNIQRKIQPYPRLMSRLQTETHARAHNEKEEQGPSHFLALPSGSIQYSIPLSCEKPNPNSKAASSPALCVQAACAPGDSPRPDGISPMPLRPWSG